MAYIEIPIEVDVNQLKDDAVAFLQTAIPGWEPASGNLETIVIEAIAEMASEQASIAAEMPTETFRQFGLRIANLQPIDGQRATGAATFTMTDTAGHTIPAGTFLTAGDVAFETTAEVTVGIGESSGVVPFQAVDEGVAANGLTGTMDLVDTLPFVDSVVITGSTADGVDAETDDDYLARLVEELQLMAPRPIVPQRLRGPGAPDSGRRSSGGRRWLQPGRRHVRQRAHGLHRRSRRGRRGDRRADEDRGRGLPQLPTRSRLRRRLPRSDVHND